MLSQVLRTIRDHALVLPGERVLVGLSGGPDSTALMSALTTLAPRLTIDLVAAVVDHGLRPDSTSEAELVAARCRSHGIACEVLPADVAAKRGRHVSLQDAARRARLAVLEEHATRMGCARIALGHTADDQAETVLFRIVRGTGVAGLAGIPHRRGAIVRPLLQVRRSAVLRFLERRKLPFVQDPSNLDRRFARSRVRHGWLPFLAAENPRVVEALLSLAKDAGRIGLGPVPAAVPGLSRRAGTVVARLAREGQGTRAVSVVGGIVEVTYGSAVFRATRGAPGPPEVTQVRGAGTYRVVPMGTALELSFGTTPPNLSLAGPDAAIFDRAALVEPLQVRPARPGDRMRPRGGVGSRKLADLLIDAKVPRPVRAFLPVLEDASGTIMFVAGLRPAEVGRPGPLTENWLFVRTVRPPR